MILMIFNDLQCTTIMLIYSSCAPKMASPENPEAMTEFLYYSNPLGKESYHG